MCGQGFDSSCSRVGVGHLEHIAACKQLGQLGPPKSQEKFSVVAKS